jgi:hypothetical protein
MTKNGVYEAEREVRTFVDLYNGASVLIGKSQEEMKGSYYTNMGALLLVAFTLEAYLNHLGSKLFKFWPQIERIPVMKKYELLCAHLDIAPGSRSSDQNIHDLFKFRNAVAHGKSQIVKTSKAVSVEEDDFHKHSPKTSEEEYCTVENAKLAREVVADFIKKLHLAAGLGTDPFVSGLTAFSVKLTKHAPE